MILERRDIVLDHERFLWKHQLSKALENPSDDLDRIRYLFGRGERPASVKIGNLTMEKAGLFLYDVRQALYFTPTTLHPDVRPHVFGYSGGESIFQHEIAHLTKARELFGRKIREFELESMFLKTDRGLAVILGVVLPPWVDPISDAQITLAPQKLSVKDISDFVGSTENNRSSFENQPEIFEQLKKRYEKQIGFPFPEE